MLLPFAKYGVREIVIFSVFWSALGAALALWVHPAAALAPALGLVFTLSFFRDPVRRIPEGEGLLVAPADGKVVEVSEVEETEFLKAPCHKIGIFLSVFDVHINRSPCDGTVLAARHTPGRFLDARNPECRHANESNSIHVGDVVVKQIAGAIARRIVCEARPNDRLARGQKYGMIKFGSRTEIFIPRSKVRELSVRLNDKVKGGETVIARTV